MAMAKSTEHAFMVCPCGHLVVRQVWMHGSQQGPPRWRYLAEPVSPVDGLPHVCVAEGKEVPSV
jgi:hypothetical protein